MIDNHYQQPQSIQTFLHKQVDRREFLLYLGTLFLLLTGVAGLMKALHEPVPNGEPSTQAFGFGDGPYGGRKSKEE